MPPAQRTNVVAAAFGRRLRRVRREALLSQEELADRAEIHRTEISLLERGRREPRYALILKLAGSLEVEPEELASGIGLDGRDANGSS